MLQQASDKRIVNTPLPRFLVLKSHFEIGVKFDLLFCLSKTEYIPVASLAASWRTTATRCYASTSVTAPVKETGYNDGAYYR